MKILITLILIIFYLQGYSQQTIFASTSDGELYTIDVANCSSNLVGLTGLGFEDIANTSDEGLWGILAGELYLIDPITASTILIGNTGMVSPSLVGLNDSTLLAEFDMKLYGIRTKDASIYEIGNIGFAACGDMTWYDNNLFMTSCNQLIKIVLNSTNTAIQSVNTVNDINNPLPSCQGLATVSVVNSDNELIGFSNQDVYKICQVDGSYKLVCPNIVTNKVYGCASIRLENQISEPSICKSTSTNDLSNPVKFEIVPNPFTFETSIITSENLNGATLIVYNSVGQIVKQLNDIFGHSFILKRNDLENGMYFIKLIQEHTIFLTRKLVITN
ncbi:MAG TPA: T9SS type A sorting domain-containing protein [Saprospiraceae bacterium]|nr:T9SS type A sorting domain-containing protein [Saprospiraceae bacterium]